MDVKDLGKVNWVIVSPGTLLLEGTHLAIVFQRSDIQGLNYHVHKLVYEGSQPRVESYMGAAPNLEIAKQVCMQVVSELVQMGLDP